LDYKNSLIPSRFIEVPVPCWESERSCICVLRISILPLVLRLFGCIVELFRPSGIFFYETYLGPLDFLLPKTIIYFRIESTWWRLYQKRVVHTNLDIDVFITNIISVCKGYLVVNDFDQNICI